jgi:hypothetical protein
MNSPRWRCTRYAHIAVAGNEADAARRKRRDRVIQREEGFATGHFFFSHEFHELARKKSADLANRANKSAESTQSADII